MPGRDRTSADDVFINCPFDPDFTATFRALISTIYACGFRTELDATFGLPRFNMPLELGIFLGARRYGGAGQRAKRTLILDVEQYRYQRFISDLAGMDIHEHGGDPLRALRETRDWLANVSHRALPSADRVARLYNAFLADLPALAVELDFDPANIPYVDFERLIVGWLLQAKPPA